MKKLLLTAAMLSGFALGACVPDTDNPEYQQKLQTKKMVAEAHSQIGMPDIINFQERRFAKQILEMRDQEITTHTYITNEMKGCLVYLGQSLGYGLPYAVQYVNPMQSVQEYHGGDHAIPQADPNGLYMPDSLSATWVLLYDPQTKKSAPVYVEPEITVSTFRIKRAEC